MSTDLDLATLDHWFGWMRNSESWRREREIVYGMWAEIERLRVVVARRADEAQRNNALLAVQDLRTRQLLAWIENVATDEQLDMPVPALCGITGRSFFAESTR